MIPALRRTHWRLALVLVAVATAMLIAGRRSADHGDSVPRWTSEPLIARPAQGREIAAGSQLQAVVDQASDGEVLCLAPGRYSGPLVIRKRLTLWGPRSAVLHGGGGTTVRVEAPGTHLLGFTVAGSGQRNDIMDAGVYCQANGARIAGLRVERALFGIVAERCHEVVIEGNEIFGDAAAPLGLRGDGIRLWEVHGARVSRNHVRHCRDILIQYAPHNTIEGNLVEYGRYGTHFMYASDGIVRGNQYLHNTVGVFVMYSRAITLTDNLFAGGMAFGGMGVGLKEAGQVICERNRMIHNQTGIYVDNSPFDKGDTIEIRDNELALSQTGIGFLAKTERTTITGNRFRVNQDQVHVDGGGDALQVEWRNNSFDDYQGYDLNRDGRGDVPYELRSFSGQLIARKPAVAFFRGSATLWLVEAIGRLFPLLQPKPVLIDPQPRLGAAQP